MKKKVLVSGIKPTGKLHIANYFGAMRQNIAIANNGDYESYVFIADYHALTSVKDGEAMRRDIFDLARAYMALGLDTNRVALFQQSQVEGHTELGWIFNNVVTMPYLMRAHAYKDNEAKNKEVNVGVFDYPVLMAADILIYHADIVPVGADQKQHVEYTRDIAGQFNRAWNTEYFHLPEALIKDEVATVPGVDGQKMSKSYNNIISLFASDEDIKREVMSIVTDSKSATEPQDPDQNNIYNIHKLYLNEDENNDLRDRYWKRGKYAGASYSYKEAKDALLASILGFIRPYRDRYEYYGEHPDEVYAALASGAKLANTRAAITMTEVKQLIGLDQ